MARVYRMVQQRDQGGKVRWVRGPDSGAGTWFLDYVDASGKRRREATDARTKTEALNLLRSRLSDNVKAEILGVASTDAVSITLERFLRDQYLPHIKATRRAGTYDNYSDYAEGIITAMGKMTLRSIGRADVQKYMEELIRTGKTPRKKPLSKATINRKIALLRSALYDAMGRGLINQNPCARMRLLPEENTRRRVMTEDEEKKLHAEAPEWLRPILKTATLAGLRQGEIVALQREDVDRERKLILVSAQSKTHKGREVPLLPELDTVLQKVPVFVGKKGASPWIFVDPLTEEPYKDYDVRNYFKRALRRAKVKGLRFHDLRRSFASRLASRGVSLQAIAKLLGHGSTYVSERYAHLSCDDLRVAIRTLSRPAPAGEVGRFPADSAALPAAEG
jgi:integrase